MATDPWRRDLNQGCSDSKTHILHWCAVLTSSHRGVCSGLSGFPLAAAATTSTYTVWPVARRPAPSPPRANRSSLHISLLNRGYFNLGLILSLGKLCPWAACGSSPREAGAYLGFRPAPPSVNTFLSWICRLLFIIPLRLMNDSSSHHRKFD